MKKFLLISVAMATMTGCASLSAPKAEYTQEDCVTHFYFDEAKQRNVITHETCTKSSIVSNRVFENGIEIQGNKSTGEFSVSTTSVKNADDSVIAEAISRVITTPGVLNSLLKAFGGVENEK